jgi:ribosomal protein S12 methylthiotransferase
LHYVYPYPHVDNIIPLMADGKLLPYLDIPFQHGSPKILKAMHRPAAAENTLTRIQKWREICPEIAIRSTFIVGFPGETDDDFEVLLDFLSEAQLDRVGCFQYSPVAGAHANALDDHIPDEIKQERWDRFMQTQQGISQKKLQSRIGHTLEVLIDEINSDTTIGRSYADAPEIDGNVIIVNSTKQQPGTLVNVTIDRADAYDLYGKIADAVQGTESI